MEALITEYGWAILKGSGMVAGLILALLRVKSGSMMLMKNKQFEW